MLSALALNLQRRKKIWHSPWGLTFLAISPRWVGDKIIIVGNVHLISSLQGILCLLSEKTERVGARTLYIYSASLRGRKRVYHDEENFRVTIPTNIPLPDTYLLSLKLWGNVIEDAPLFVFWASRSSLEITNGPYGGAEFSIIH